MSAASRTSRTRASLSRSTARLPRTNTGNAMTRSRQRRPARAQRSPPSPPHRIAGRQSCPANCADSCWQTAGPFSQTRRDRAWTLRHPSQCRERRGARNLSPIPGLDYCRLDRLGPPPITGAKKRNAAQRRVRKPRHEFNRRRPARRAPRPPAPKNKAAGPKARRKVFVQR